MKKAKKRALIKRASKRLLSGIVACVTLSGVLISGSAFATDVPDEATAAVTTDGDDASELASTAATGDSLGETAEGATLPGASDGMLEIEANGAKTAVKTGTVWAEAEVIGGDSPTLEPFPVESFANSKAFDPGKNVYSLTVATGMCPGESVEYFCVRYKDQNDVKQTKYLFPKTHSLKEANDYVNKLVNGAESSDQDSQNADEYKSIASISIQNDTGHMRLRASDISSHDEFVTLAKQQIESALAKGGYFYCVATTDSGSEIVIYDSENGIDHVDAMMSALGGSTASGESGSGSDYKNITSYEISYSSKDETKLDGGIDVINVSDYQTPLQCAHEAENKVNEYIANGYRAYCEGVVGNDRKSIFSDSVNDFALLYAALGENSSSAGSGDGLTNSALKHDTLNELGYTINESTATETALTSWSVDEYLFRTETSIKEVVSMEVFMSKGKWTVNGISLSEVDSVYGYGEYGFYSGKYFLALDKTKISEMKSLKKGALTLNASGDKLFNIGGKSSIYFTINNSVSDDKITAPQNDVYSFRLDIADALDSGIESYLRNDPSNSSPINGTMLEDLALEVEYQDKNGWTRNVTMPVMLSVLGQYKASGDTVHTIGLAQRGDTLAFTGCLPEYKDLLTMKVHVGKSARDVISKNCGMEFTGTVPDSYLAELNSDYIELAGVSLYEGTCRMSNYSDGIDALTNEKLQSYTAGFAFSQENPKYYFTTTAPDGMRINPGSSSPIDMVEYSPGDPLIASKIEGNILVRFRTSDVDKIASTQSDVKVQFTYQTYSGAEKHSLVYSMKDEVLNFMGYWPSSDGLKDNFAYTYGMTMGNYVEFPVSLPDVAVVTDIAISIDRFGDTWQLSGISIEVLDSVSRRRVYAQDLTSQSSTSKYRIVRSCDKTVIPPYPIEVTRLFMAGDSFTYSMGSGSFTPIQEADYNAVRFSMTYDQTKENYGFSKVKKTYDIDVKVADDDSKNNINGDSGSRNLFYFQLIFKNGSSAFVLANQQLASDAFRAGYNEMFAIKINRDYGDLTAVRIVPESTTEEGEVFDKLNVEQITVTERNNGGSGMQYVFNSVGWIGIDYNDSGDKTSLAGRKGHTVGELASTYSVSLQRKVVNMLCEVSTKPWDDETPYFPLSASISCDLEYIDTNGQPRTLSFDVVDRMYDYIKQTPKTFEAKSNGSNLDLYMNMGAISDPESMLRPNKCDRFVIPPIADAKSLKRMTFNATNRGNGTGKWTIGDLTISRIESDSGNIELLKNGEYYRSMVVEEHCKIVPEQKGISLTVPVGTPIPLTIELTDNAIDWIDGTSWISAVSRVPDSTNDLLNLYLYPSSNSTNIANVSVSAALRYSLPNSKMMQVSQSKLNVARSGTSDAVFYYTGLSASDMQTLSELRVQCRDSSVSFSHAIVQQIRENVVVCTYYIPIGGASAILGLRAVPAATTEVLKPTHQELMLSLDEDTTEMSLFNSGGTVNDIAVAFKYTTTLDDTSEFYSPFVYLTDVGIDKISPGKMLTIPFRVPYVKEITGYSIVSFGNIGGGYNGAQMLNYSYTTYNIDPVTKAVSYNGEKLLNIYSFNQAEKLANARRDLHVTDIGCTGRNSMNLLDLTFTTPMSDPGSPSSTESPVEMTIFYTNDMGGSEYITFPDIRRYIQGVYKPVYDERTKQFTKQWVEEKQFSPNTEARIMLFLPNCENITSIGIKPYNDSGDASWKISSIDGSIGTKNINERASISRPLEEDEVFLQINGGGEVSLKSVIMITYYTVGGKTDWVRGHKAGISIEGEKSVPIQVNVKGGFTAKAEWIVDGSASDATSGILSRKTENSVIFNAPKNTSDSALTYRVTVISNDNPAVKDVITFNIPVPDTPPETTTVSARNTQPPATTATTPVIEETTGETEPPTETTTEAPTEGTTEQQNEEQQTGE